MPNEQSRTFQTAGDLKRELQNIPDDAKLQFGSEQSSSSMGVSLQRQGTNVIFGVGGQGASGQGARQQT